MVRIFDATGREVERTTTVASLKEQRGKAAHSAQVTVATSEEAAAAEVAGIEMAVCRYQDLDAVRRGSSRIFLTVAIDFSGEVTEDGLLRAAFIAVNKGADAVITVRSFSTVNRIASEDIPVMGHLGFVPQKSTLFGGIRAIGKNASEAGFLWGQFRRLEEAGAFAVECELIPAKLMAEINERTGLVTISLGSGGAANVMFLFTSDICGQSNVLPRHARSYGNLAQIEEKLQNERIAALKGFRKDVASKGFPKESELCKIDNGELRQFIESIA